MPINTALSALMTLPSDDRTDEQRRADQRRTQRGLASAWLLLGAAPTGLLLGWLVDASVGTLPWFTIGCGLVFLLVALVHLLKELR